MQPLDLGAALDGLIAAAERALLAATGGENVCRLDKAGRATGGVKYHEGSLVALRAARRLLQSADAATCEAALLQLHDQWRAELRAQQARAQPSPSWLAYTQGGVDALGQALPPGAADHDGDGPA